MKRRHIKFWRAIIPEISEELSANKNKLMDFIPDGKE